MLLQNQINLIQLSLFLDSEKYLLIYTMSFLSIQLFKKLLYPFGLTCSLSPFLFIFFRLWTLFDLFLQFFSVKRSNNSLDFKITNNICPRCNIFNYFHHKNVFRPAWNIVFWKYVFIFWYSDNIPNSKVRIFIVNFFTRFNVFDLKSTGSILSVLWNVLLYLLTTSSNLSMIVKSLQ